ncbi:MAG: hypothetical protein ACREN5_09560 [Gemmatimonadales bacterium]
MVARAGVGSKHASGLRIATGYGRRVQDLGNRLAGWRFRVVVGGMGLMLVVAGVQALGCVISEFTVAGKDD